MKRQGNQIAVIGSGAAGLAAAYMLSRQNTVTLIEKSNHVGGHVNTLDVPDGPDAGTPVDTGFIVMNHRNYPLLTRLFEQLNVELRDSDMSFAYHDATSGLQYSGTSLNGLFGQRRNVLSPSFHGMVRDILRFYKRTAELLETDGFGGESLGEYLQKGGYGQAFIRHHIIPMGSAIWSTPCADMMDFPAQNFAHFFSNHGLLSTTDRPQWRTVSGGSREYVRRLLGAMDADVRKGVDVKGIRRNDDGVKVSWEGGEEHFDLVVVATHADQALALLEDASDEERRLLGAWSYSRNHTVLHSDAAVMPPLRRVWASWNYARFAGEETDAPSTLTYHMNRLQGLETAEDYFVSLNAGDHIDQARIVAEIDYEHPTFTAESLATQSELPLLNGRRRTFFCGSYFGYGFHEDAVRSGVDVGRAFGLEL